MVNSRCKSKIFLAEYKMKSYMFFHKMKQHKQKKTPSVDCCKSSNRKESFCDLRQM